MPEKLFIVDAMAMAFRNYHAFGAARGGLKNSQGFPTSAVFGSMMFLTKLVQDERPDYLVIACDSREKTFRHEIYPAYKANRSEMPEDLACQLPYLFRLFDSLGIPVLKQPGLEADDLIGSLVKAVPAPTQCYIVSGDKDFMQLIDERTFLYIPQKGGGARTVRRAEVEEKIGCQPEQVIDYLAIIGDAVDNFSGVNGIGEKGASLLIQKFGSLDNIYANLEAITNLRQQTALITSKEQAYLAQRLATIKTDAAIPWQLPDLRCQPEAFYSSRSLLTLCDELEFKTRAREIRSRLTAAEEVTAPAPTMGSIATSKHDYQLINDRSAFDKLLEQLADQTTLVIDTETTGLDAIMDEAIGVSLTFTAGRGYYLPLVTKHLKDLTPEAMKRGLSGVLRNDACLKVGHNIKFDLQMLKNSGIEMRGALFDTMIASQLLDPNDRAHGLDHLCLKHLRYQKIPTSSLMGDNKSIPMLAADLNQLAQYACEDADLTWQLYKFLAPRLGGEGLDYVFHHIEMPLLPVLATMEQNGVFLDKNTLRDLSEKLTMKEEALRAEIYALAGEEFNINSPRQLQVVLYEKMKIPEQVGMKRVKKTKSGLSTDVSVLEQLADHPLPSTILEYRTITKLKNTYVDTLPELVSQRTQRLHTSYHQMGAATGRLSSTEPNLQNIPIRSEFGRQIRKAFRCAAEDSVLITADYSQVELRILAHLSEDEALRAAFARDEDIHTATAAQIFNVPPAEVNSDQRAQAKAINFGIIYGMGPQRLARETGVGLATAKTFIQRYFECYPGIARYIEQTVAFARENEFARTITGRKRPIPEIKEKNALLQKSAQNIAINSPVQGSAADLIKVAMIHLQKKLEESQLRAKILLQVHDELVLECPQNEVATVSLLIKETMESALPISVPLKVDVGVGLNWLEAH